MSNYSLECSFCSKKAGPLVTLKGEEIRVCLDCYHTLAFNQAFRGRHHISW